VVVVPLLIWGLVQAFLVPDRYAIAGPPIHGTDGVAGSDSGGDPPQASTSGRVQHPAVACAESLERLPEIAGKHGKRTKRRDLLHTIAAPAVCIETTFPPELDLAYFFADGTSLAALAVTGTIALCITDSSWPVWPPGSQPSTVQADTASYDLSDPGHGYEGDPPAAPGQFNGFLLTAAPY
jgi:hypothetical protein